MRREGKSTRDIAAKEGISHAQVRKDLEDAEKDGLSVETPGGKVKGGDDRVRPSKISRQKYYGDTINFRALLHAPINEQGVVFLFGMVARELGFIVEAVQNPYPDCEGKREKKKGKWEKVIIEFEFRSRNFQDHRHDSKKCDLIVCWEDNWPDCDIEVLELKSEIEKLEA